MKTTFRPDEWKDTGHLLGVGARGRVKLVVRGEETAALKVPLENNDVNAAAEAEAREEFRTECAAFRAIPPHPHLLRCLGFVVESVVDVGVLTEALETCMWNALADEENARTFFPTAEEALATLRGVALALAHLHAHGRVHSDLRTPNVFLKREKENVVAVVGDVGSVEPTGDAIHPHYRRERAKFAHLAGWDDVMTPAVDVFSFGVLLAEAAILRKPLTEVRELVREKGLSSHRSALDAGALVGTKGQDAWWTDLCALVQRCTRFDPCERPTMDAVIEDVERLLLANDVRS